MFFFLLRVREGLGWAGCTIASVFSNFWTLSKRTKGLRFAFILRSGFVLCSKKHLRQTERITVNSCLVVAFFCLLLITLIVLNHGVPT